MKKFITALVILIGITMYSQTYEIGGHKQFHAKNEIVGDMNHLTFRNVDFDGLMVTDTVKLSKETAQQLLKELSKNYQADESFTLKAVHKTIKVSYHKHKGKVYRKIVFYSLNQHSQFPFLTNRQIKILFGL